MPQTKRLNVMPMLYILLIYLFFFLLKSPVLANDTCFSAIKLCYTKVIPSLFPFLVLNELIVSSGLSMIIGNSVGKPISKLFSVSQISSVCFMSGGLFGFPLGTKSVCSLYENKYISKEESERLVCFCSNTGPSFVLGFAGIILQSIKLAVVIYICQIISAVIIGLALRKKGKQYKNCFDLQNDTFSFASIPSAITSSVIPMLNICSFVCFFAIISVSVENILRYINAGGHFNIFINGFLEITNGISKLETIGANGTAVFLCAFFIGWSGLSVILQSINIMSNHGIKYKKFIISKLFQGIICALLSVVACKLLKLY